MNADMHERARMLIALAGGETLDGPDESWLAAHLESCASCREFAQTTRETVRSLRAIAVTAGAGLVSTTQLRVRQRARELERRQERLLAIWACCSAVTLSAALTTAALWRGFAWIGQQARLAAPVWGIAFVVFSLMPAIVAGILLLARGTCLVPHNGSYQE